MPTSPWELPSVRIEICWSLWEHKLRLSQRFGEVFRYSRAKVAQRPKSEYLSQHNKLIIMQKLDTSASDAQSEGSPTRSTIKNQYLIREVLGKGGFGKVYSAVDKLTGREIALKVSSLRPDYQEALILEARDTYSKKWGRDTLRDGSSECRQVCSCESLMLQVWETSSWMFIAMELAAGGPLDAIVSRNKWEGKCIIDRQKVYRHWCLEDHERDTRGLALHPQ